ncbi:hypothetical protein COOONC_06697, partial [Cooperia oncophora]
KDSITLETAQKVVQRFESAVDDDDYGAIYTYFDDLFNICRVETTIRRWNIWLELIQSLIKAFKAFKPDLVNALCHAVSAGETFQENLAEVCADRVEILQMLVYFIQRLTFHLEGAVIKRAYRDLGVEIDGNDIEFDEEGDTFNSDLPLWKEIRSQIIDMIGFICCINIPRGNGESVENAIKFLWRPADANSQLLRSLASIIIKFAAHPRFAKAGSSSAELRQLLEHLRPICVDFKLATEVARILVKASLHFEYLNDPRITDYPFVEPIKKLSIDGDMDQMMSHMLYFVGLFRPRETSAQSVPKPFALLIQKLAQCAPLTFFENIRGVLPFLDYDPPTMRSAILGAFCDVICGPDMKPRYLRPGRDARLVRDIMADQLQAHLADSNLQVRTQALNCWVVIANNRRVPFDSLKKGLVYAVAERLHDKSVNTRKVAMQFLVLYLLLNPYGKNLDFENLSLTCEKLNAHKERIKLIDPDRPGFFAVMERFKSFEDKMRATLESIMDARARHEIQVKIAISSHIFSTMALLVDMIEISMRDTLCVLVKLLYLGRFKDIDLRIGDSFANCTGDTGEPLLQEMETAYEENMDLIEHALRVTQLQEKMVFAEQMTQVFPILADSLKQNGFTDVSYAVTFCATCERFGIRNAACALYDLYNLGNPTLSAEVINTVMVLFIKKKDRNRPFTNGTSNNRQPPVTRDSHAITELLYHMFSRNKIPPGLISHLIKIINEAQPVFCKYPAMVVLALFARVDPRTMREYLRDFQRCLRSSEVLLASEALHAMSYLIPSGEVPPDEENEAYLYRLRAIDSLFPDMEKFLFRVILSDDDTVESKYWYVSMRHCLKALFTLSSDIDYAVSRILGKGLWYAHRAAQLLIMYREEPPKELNSDFVKARREYFNIAWQRTTERVLMLFGEAIECLLVHVDNYFPKLLKRAMALDEAAAEQLDEPIEPYSDYDKPHSGVEMDFAYREGLFARTIASLAKSRPESGDSADSEVESERTDRPSASGEDEDEDDSNRPSTDELIRTRTQALFQTRLLLKTGVIGRCLALVVFFIRCSGIPEEIRNAALRAFSKFLLICRNKIPPGLISHLIKIVNEAQPVFCKYPAMVVLALFARVDPRTMREYLRDFQRCLRSSEVLVASEALHAMSYLIPSGEVPPDEENEAYLYRLRAIDSLFPDMEKFLFRVILSDDDTVESKYWYVSMRHCLKALFTLSSDIDYAVSRILGKGLWYAHRAAQLLIMYREEPPKELNSDFVKARREYFNIAWQRTTERVLMLFGEAIECLLIHVDNYFPKLLKRAMALDEAAAEQLDEPIEPYSDYDKPHSGVEMDFAYREGLFARTIASLAKSRPESGDSADSEVESERTDRPSASEEDEDEDDSNREFHLSFCYGEPHRVWAP